MKNRSVTTLKKIIREQLKNAPLALLDVTLTEREKLEASFISGGDYSKGFRICWTQTPEAFASGRFKESETDYTRLAALSAEYKKPKPLKTVKCGGRDEAIKRAEQGECGLFCRVNAGKEKGAVCYYVEYWEPIEYLKSKYPYYSIQETFDIIKIGQGTHIHKAIDTRKRTAAARTKTSAQKERRDIKIVSRYRELRAKFYKSTKTSLIERMVQEGEKRRGWSRRNLIKVLKDEK